jgi:chaperone required for assembly of F1-ATPase
MKRFYAEVAVDAGAILLDGRPVRTPARAPLVLPTAALAEAVAAEWREQGERIEPATMPTAGLANAAIDRVAPDPAAFAAPLARYAKTDALCYRAENPATLRREQAEAWDPLLDWARARFDVMLLVTDGVVPVTQPPATIARLGEALAARDAFALAGLQPLVTIGSSLVTALAVVEGAIGAEAAFAATHLDESWQARQWGEDDLAARTRAARERDFLAAARFLALL